MQIRQPSQYRCIQLHYRFAVISKAPSIYTLIYIYNLAGVIKSGGFYMIFGGFMVHDKMIKLLWKWFHAIYEKNTYIYIYIVYSNINEITQMQIMQKKYWFASI